MLILHSQWICIRQHCDFKGITIISERKGKIGSLEFSLSRSHCFVGIFRRFSLSSLFFCLCLVMILIVCANFVFCKSTEQVISSLTRPLLLIWNRLVQVFLNRQVGRRMSREECLFKLSVYGSNTLFR